MHATIKPKLSIEIGLAYGFSTLFILDAAFHTNAGRHIAIDPFQDSMWHGIGRQAVKELSFDSKFEHIPETSVTALTDLSKQGAKADYIYIDGAHTFDYALVDFFCSNRVLNVGGILIFDDMWMPAIQKVASFIRSQHERLPGTAHRGQQCLMCEENQRRRPPLGPFRSVLKTSQSAQTVWGRVSDPAKSSEARQGVALE